ncbi:MAG: acyltransferase family protein [Atopobiaceae bacterium]|nr:acyltransferase family protein [Atopobiaceae bacterium]
MTAQNKGTIHYIQWVRAVGAVAIVLLHAFVTMRIAYSAEVLGAGRLALEEAISIVFTRWAVPVFFMISGALMLDPQREMGWKKLLGHVWRLAFVLLTFGFGFCIAECVVNAGEFSAPMLLDAFNHLLDQDSWDHMWYVYELLGFYLMTPLIRPWVAQASREEYGKVAFWACVLLLGTRAVSGFLPYAMYYGVSIPHCFAYYLIGYYVITYLELETRWIVAGLVSLVSMLVLSVGFGCDWVTEPIRAFVTPYSIAVLLAFKRYLDVPLDKYPVVSLIADYSFGIYLIHPAFQHAMVMLRDMSAYPAVVADIALTVIPLVLSIATIWLLRLIPGFKGKI